MATEQLQSMIQDTIAKLSEYKAQEAAIVKQTTALADKTYDSVLVEFNPPSNPDATMVFTSYIGGKKHSFPFYETGSKDAFYTSLASFLGSLVDTVNAQKTELKTKLNELNNAL